MLKKILVTVLCLFVVVCNAEVYVGGNADVTNGLVAHWKLDEISYNGTAGEVKDSSGNGNNGTSYGKVITNPGKIGRSAYFNGIGTMIEINKSAELHLSQDWSLSLWIKSTSEEYGRRAISNRGIGDGGSVFDVHVANPQAFIDYYGVSQTGIYAPEGISNRWECVTIIISAGFRSYYINGIRTDFTYYPYVYDGNLQPIRIGDWYPFGNSDNFIGFIDDVRIYNRAITPEEVTRLYKLGNDKIKETVVYSSKNVPYENLPTNGLIAHWKLDELNYNGTAGEVKDSSGNGYSGTATGDLLSNPGKQNRSTSFDERNSINIASASDIFTGASTKTVSFWAKRLNFVNDNHGILSFGDSETRQFWVFIGHSTWNDTVVQIKTTISGLVTLDVENSFPQNTWTFFTYVIDQSVLKLYTNSTFCAQVGFSGEIVAGNTFNYIGEINPFGKFNGSIDDVRIYNRALSASEIKALYEARPVEESVAVVYDGETLISNPLKKDYAKAKYQNITNGLVAWWKLDEIGYNGTAGEVKDSSGNGNNGTSFSKAITNPSKLGRSAFFDGITSGIRIDDSSFISEAGPYTLSVWIYPLLCSYGERILAKRGTTCRFDLLINNDSTIEFYNGLYSTGIPTGSSMLNRWMNIVVVADGISTIGWYIDGVLIDSYNNRNIVGSDADIGIGCFGSGAAKFNGSIDDVRIYNRALSPEEVQTLYKYREE